ncbi:MAG: GIY-YIG nuclease family protein [Roseivirga sp.]|nr:GIY-YIG nuclease family protein [Roseivirga sp.]
MFTVYAIRSISRNYTYIGMSAELEVRVQRHNVGGNKTTRAYAPFKLIHTKSFDTRLEARNYEKYLKSGVGREWLKGL